MKTAQASHRSHEDIAEDDRSAVELVNISKVHTELSNKDVLEVTEVFDEAVRNCDRLNPEKEDEMVNEEEDEMVNEMANEEEDEMVNEEEDDVLDSNGP